MDDPVLLALIETINAEIHLFHRLLALFGEEQGALVQDDLAGLDATLDSQQEVAEEAKRLEQERLWLVRALSQDLDLKPGKVSLARLVDALEGDTGQGLARMRQILLELGQKVRDTNARHASLIRRSLCRTGRGLDILSGQPCAGG